ncbi:MAG: restriction endonuclease subunit S [Pseudomonadota bacterium]
MEMRAHNTLPVCWSIVEFGKLCTFTQGIQVPINKQFETLKQNTVRFLRIIDFTQGNEAPRYIHYPGDKYVVKRDDISMVRYGTVGFVCTGLEGAIANNLFRVIPNIFIEKKYLFYFLNSYLFKKNINSKGATMQALSFGLIKPIQIPVPPLPEQHRIVAKIEELFSELDNGIENLKKAREQLKTYRQAVLKYAFEGKLTKEWRVRQIQTGNPPEPAEKLLERIRKEMEKHFKKQAENWEKVCEQAIAEGKKKPAKPKKPKELPPLSEKELAELPELPEGWCWLRIEHIGDIETGMTPSKKSSVNYGNNYPFYKPTDLNERSNVRKAHDNLSEIGYLKARVVPINSILVTCIGATIGKTGIIRKEGAFNQQINAIIPFNNIVPDYVYYQAICPFFQNQIVHKASSTTLPILNKSKFEKLVFVLAPYEEQNTIVCEIESRLSVCDQLEQTIEDSLKKAEALRQSILKKAFSGELTKDWRDKHTELISGENSAEKLLELIKAEKEKTRKNSPQRRRERRGKKYKD